MHTAIRLDDLGVFESLIKQFHLTASLAEFKKQSALTYAINEEKFDFVRILLSANYKNSDGLVAAVKK